MRRPLPEEVEMLTKRLIDQGQLMRAGFVGLRHTVIAVDAPEGQVKEMEMAFMAGAQHLFGSIMTMLEPGREPTKNDYRRMTAIAEELDAWGKKFIQELPTQGGRQ